jgi:hypothetical protein
VSRPIFVEGFPGAGKSTTAQFLARRLVRRGGQVRWVYEGEVPNPFVPSGGYQSWEQFAERRVERWRAFAAVAVEDDVTLVPESAFLQLPVFAMLRRNVDPSLITALVGRLVEAVAPLRPALVYLARRDPEGAFRAIGEQRGLAWLLHHMAESGGYQFLQTRGLSGLDGLLAYWRAHADLCGAIVERVDLPKLVLEVGANGWVERRRRICQFVGVPYQEDPIADAPTIAKVTGRFSDGKRKVTIEMVEGRLALRGTLWRSNALLPVAPDVFDVESLPLRLNSSATPRRGSTPSTAAARASGGPRRPVSSGGSSLPVCEASRLQVSFPASCASALGEDTHAWSRGLSTQDADRRREAARQTTSRFVQRDARCSLRSASRLSPATLWPRLRPRRDGARSAGAQHLPREATHRAGLECA